MLLVFMCRDPQGEVQGPFASAEMAEWFNSGYFTMALSVRRACDERFVQLGELTKMWGGRLPFLPGQHMPPLKLLNDSAVVNPMVAEQEKIHMIQQQLIQQQLFQQQMMQQQHMMVRQQSIVSKLSQMDGWNTLSSIQQQQIVNQHMMNIRPHAPTLVNSDPLLQQLRIQMEAQAKLQAEMLHRSKDPASALVMQHMQHQQQQPPKSAPESVLVEGSMKQDPIQAFVQQLLGGQSKKPVAPPVPAKEMDPIQSLLQQAQWGVPPNQAPPGGSVMEQQQHGAPGFHGMPPGPGLVPWPPHAMPIAVPSAVMYPSAVEPPTSVWDLEKAKIEENKRMLEQQQLAEIRRREEEEKRMKEEEDRKRREMKEREEERRRHEELRREAEARQQAEELRRRELERQQQLEEKRRRQEEEKMRKEEEMRQQQAEEERIRREEERIRREEERAAEQQRRQQEALLRLQEQQAAAQAQARLQQQQAAAAAAAAAQEQLQQQQSQMKAQAAPWAQQQQNHQQQHSRGESLSLAEIQKLQEEKEMKDRAAEQAQKQEQAARAAALLQQQAAIKLRWVKQNVSTAAPKSLAEIQAEEAAQLARQKEKERVEKATQPVNLNLAAAGAWGASSSSVASGASHSGSAWSSGRTAAAVVGQTANNSANSGWKAGSIGFWEDPSPRKAQSAAAPASKQTASKQQQAAASAAAANASGVQGKAAQASTESVSKKNRTNKEEETVRKLFGQTAEKKDSFSQWCFEYLKKVQAPIDVPTFVCFLKVTNEYIIVSSLWYVILGEFRTFLTKPLLTKK